MAAGIKRDALAARELELSPVRVPAKGLSCVKGLKERDLSVFCGPQSFAHSRETQPCPRSSSHPPALSSSPEVWGHSEVTVVKVSMQILPSISPPKEAPLGL